MKVPIKSIPSLIYKGLKFLFWFSLFWLSWCKDLGY